MSERFAIEMPGSAPPMSPDIFELREGDVPLMELVLRLSGIDPKGGLDGRVLNDVHLIELTPGAKIVAEET